MSGKETGEAARSSKYEKAIVFNWSAKEAHYLE